MLQLRWTSVTITTNKQANEMLRQFKKLQPEIGAFDTETTGLHIISDTPFLFQFGYINPNLKEGYTYAVDLERQPQLARAVIKNWNVIAKSLKIYLAHNIKYDLHMCQNIGLSYETENISDTMFYIRYGHDALTPKNGGPPLKLKEYMARYIDPKAKDHEKLLDLEKSTIAKELNLKLKFRLGSCGTPPAKYGARSYTLKVLDEIFKDPIMAFTDLPDRVREAYLDWLHEDIPLYLQHKITGLVEPDMIPYNILNRKNLIPYAHYDIIAVLEVYLQLAPIVKNRENEQGLVYENNIIFPLLEMERVGFQIDKEYLLQAKTKLKAYIKSRRQTFYELAGRELKTGQHAVVKQILADQYHLDVTATGKEELDKLHSDLIRETGHDTAVQFIEVLQELRTLEKWYSTYILRFLKDLHNTNRLYTTIHQVGTVSGRVTSDFQQFPKKAIVSITGEELFHPRKMILPTGGDYDAIVYLDYSQIELRFQALYTILVGHPDLNLCRAYMPFRCVNISGVGFDCNNPDHIRRWHEDWYLEENPTIKWTATDVHGATTEKATGLTSADPEFKGLRSVIGKRVNFAKNYGATLNRIRQMFPNKTEEEVKRIDASYYLAFPGVKFYHQYCYEMADAYSNVVNLFGVRYYGVSGHKLINLLIQGSSAYYLKWKIRELYDYRKAHGIKSRFQMNIHDELSWERHKEDFYVFFEFQKIMQDWPDAIVPIVAEMDATCTTWADKKGVHNADDLRLHLST